MKNVELSPKELCVYHYNPFLGFSIESHYIIYILLLIHRKLTDWCICFWSLALCSLCPSVHYLHGSGLVCIYITESWIKCNPVFVERKTKENMQFVPFVLFHHRFKIPNTRTDDRIITSEISLLSPLVLCDSEALAGVLWGCRVGWRLRPFGAQMAQHGVQRDARLGVPPQNQELM